MVDQTAFKGVYRLAARRDKRNTLRQPTFGAGNWWRSASQSARSRLSRLKIPCRASFPPSRPNRRPAEEPIEPERAKNVVVFGANVARQCIGHGLLDEIVVHLAPVLLGDGVRLFGGPGTRRVDLERTSVAQSGQLTDLRFRVGEVANCRLDLTERSSGDAPTGARGNRKGRRRG